MKNKGFIRFIAVALILAALPLGMLSCAKGRGDSNKINVVCTVFPQYDWLKNIIGDSDRVSLKLIVKNGSDLHSYQASVRDIVDISSSDMLVYVGGESDAWVERSMAQASNENMLKVNMIELLGDRAIHTDGHEHGHDHDHSHEHTYDEHVWLSLKNADVLCRALAQKLCELDPEGKEGYLKNAEEYCGKLLELDKLYESTVAESRLDTLLFADRFPFIYLTSDYGIKYHAAFSGCSADSEASFETVAHLSSTLDELKLPCVLTVDSGSTSIASAVIANSNSKDCKTLSLCSMQAVKQSDIDNGVTYISIMEQNQKVLTEALS